MTDFTDSPFLENCCYFIHFSQNHGKRKNPAKPFPIQGLSGRRMKIIAFPCQWRALC